MRQHDGERHAPFFRPFAHHGETVDDRHVLGMRRRGDGAFHLAVTRMLQDGGRELQVHQHHVDPRRLHALGAGADQFRRVGRIDVVQQIVGADLPDDEIGMIGDHVGVDPLERRARDLAADAAIEDADLHVGESRSQELRQPAGIGFVGPRRAGAVGRGRAEGDDGQGPALGEALRHVRQLHVQRRDVAAGGAMIDVGLGVALAGRQQQQHHGDKADHGDRHDRILAPQLGRARLLQFLVHANGRRNRSRPPSFLPDTGKSLRPIPPACLSAR